MQSSLFRIGILAAAIGAVPSAWAQVLIGPTPYLSFADSPFSAGPSFSYFHLENFEDNVFAPGWTASNGWVRVGPSVFTDSVDGDDGAIDGSGAAGSSFYSGNIASILTITFDASVLGALPTHVGVVWTDVGNATPFGVTHVSFEAFDSASMSLGATEPFPMGDGSALGATAEDRFFGITFSGGIARIQLNSSGSTGSELAGAAAVTDWEVDHLQYGRAAPLIGAVPEPATMGILAGGVLLTIAFVQLRRRSVHRAKLTNGAAGPSQAARSSDLPRSEGG
jgi:PEP-CTERM motif